MNGNSDREIKLVRSYRLTPSIVRRVKAAAVFKGLSDTDIVQGALVEYLRKIEREMKREEIAE